MNLNLPAILRSLDSNLQTISSSAWARRQGSIWYPRMTRRRSMESGVDYIQWLLETAKIRPMNRGGRNVYSDQMGVNFSVIAEEFGDDLKMSRMQILNAIGATQNGAEKNALDVAASWSRQMGGWAAYWPQLQTAGVMLSGTNAAGAATGVTCYDGKSFFATDHPVNPSTKSSGATFTNLFYGRPLTAANYAEIGAYIEAIPGPDGLPRKVKPRIVATGSDKRFQVTQLFDARSASFTDPLSPTGAAAASNITIKLYDTEAPISDADLNCSGAQAGTWWIAAELMEDDQLAGVIYDEREAFWLRSYADVSDAQLAREENFEWKFRGWNQIASGHPYLLFQCRPDVPGGQVPWPGI